MLSTPHFPLTDYEIILDRDSYDAALKLVEDLGPSAAFEALNKVDASERENNTSSIHFWRRVEAAVSILLNEDTRGAIH